MARFSFFGKGLPEIDLAELKGKLIVLEGTDGVGRSTHIDLLKQWLEIHGMSSSIEDVFKDLRRRVDGIIEGNGD